MTTLLPFRFRATRTRTWRHAMRYLLLILMLPMSIAQADVTTPGDAQAGVDATPNDPATWVVLGDAELAAGDEEAAKNAYLEAIARDYLTCDAHYGLGLTEYARSDLDAAHFSFEEVARLCPTRFDGHYNRAVTLARLQRPAEAIQAFERALEEAEPEAGTGDRVNALGGLASQQARTGAFDAAADAYARARALQPDDDDFVYLHGEALWRAGRGLEALPDLTTLESQGGDAEVSILIADIYLSAGRTEYALRTLDRAIVRAREASDRAQEADLQLRRGTLLRGLGRSGEATDAIRAASQLDPDRFDTQYALGVSLLDAGEYVAAREALLAAQEHAGNEDVAATFALAEAFELLEQPADALHEVRRVLTLLPVEASGDVVGPTRADALLLAGRSAYRTGAFEESLGYLEEARAISDDDPVAHVWTGLAAYQLGSFGDAARAFERALVLEPDDLATRRNLAAAHLAGERFDAAVDMYLLFVEQDPGDVQSAYQLGWAYIGLQDRVSARDVWASTCELGYRAACDALAEVF